MCGTFAVMITVFAIMLDIISNIFGKSESVPAQSLLFNIVFVYVSRVNFVLTRSGLSASQVWLVVLLLVDRWFSVYHSRGAQLFPRQIKDHQTECLQTIFPYSVAVTLSLSLCNSYLHNY